MFQNFIINNNQTKDPPVVNYCVVGNGALSFKIFAKLSTSRIGS